MKVILLQEVDNLGDEGDVVVVKPGFGRNFLIPRGIARLATAGAIKAWEEERRQAARKLAQKKGDAETLAKELAGIELVLTAKVGEENRIFGSITPQMIADSLSHEGISVDRRKVTLDEEIRHLGVYTASVKLHKEVIGQVKVRVEPEGGVAPAAVAETPAEAAAETPETPETPAESAEPSAEPAENTTATE